MSEAEVKGWCPGAWKPMMSGDGLIVRVRPQRAALSTDQALGLCDLALQFGSGVIDLTNRANLQIRGVKEDAHEALLQALAALDLLDADPELESRRNILTAPFWQRGDKTARLARMVAEALPRLPELPAKVGIAIDTGPAPILVEDPADFRFERAARGLILRADGCARGREVTDDTAIDALVEMAEWFAEHRTGSRRRMAQVLCAARLPKGWDKTPPKSRAPRPVPGPHGMGALVGLPFGQIEAQALRDLLATQDVRGLRITPWRMLLLEGADMPEGGGFVTDPDDPILTVDACPGAPFCPQSTVETRDLARQLAPAVTGGLHVSGCAKGCARKAAAEVVLVGREGRFDLVHKGHAWDEPAQTGLTPQDILTGAC